MANKSHPSLLFALLLFAAVTLLLSPHVSARRLAQIADKQTQNEVEPKDIDGYYEEEHYHGHYPPHGHGPYKGHWPPEANNSNEEKKETDDLEGSKYWHHHHQHGHWPPASVDEGERKYVQPEGYYGGYHGGEYYHHHHQGPYSRHWPPYGHGYGRGYGDHN